MRRRRIGWIVAGVALLALLAWATSKWLERLVRQEAPVEETAAPAPTPPTPHITATLFYATQDGLALVPVRRDVPLAEGTVAQGKQIVLTQLQEAPPPYTSVIPAGTSLRAFYITERGDAFVDLSAELTTKHPGGSLTELLTVSALVNAVTTNLPAIKRVQILIDGKEVDTIAGHVDIRRPLEADVTLVRQPGASVDNPPAEK